MKSHFTPILLLLFFSLNLKADVISWNGGVGSWDDPTSWDAGTVPSLVDTAFIGSGSLANIPSGLHTVKHLIVEGTLLIDAAATLVISNATETGLYIGGILRNSGTLLITGTGLYAIECEGNFVNLAGATFIADSCERGVLTEPGSIIRNSGQMLVDEINHRAFEVDGYFLNRAGGLIDVLHTSGIWFEGGFDNYGTVTITNSSKIAISCINCDCINEVGARITVDSAGLQGIYTTQLFRNKGIIKIVDAEKDLLYSYTGTFQNGTTGEITLEGASETGIKMVLSNFENRGQVVLEASLTQNAMELQTSSLDNIGELLLQSTAPTVVDDISFLYNHPCATLQLKDSLINGNYIDNEGWLRYHSDKPFSNSELFYNSGVIEDLNGNFDITTLTTHTGIHLAPIAGPATVGVPLPNALGLGSLANFTIYNDDWYTAEDLLTPAGDYDPLLNEFTPSAAADGLSTFYLGIRDVANSCNEIFQIAVVGGVVAGPVRPPSGPLGGNGLVVAHQEPEAVEVFPNPAAERFEVRSTVPFAQPLHLAIYDSQGRQLVSQTLAAAGQRRVEVNLDARLPAGMYWLRIAEEGQAPRTLRLVINLL
ncbi:MAG: T9SS type A sorting domain-containing protein [Bacteroidota bacterium]